ncbi:MAG: 2'-5' RNA ligase [Candidatus Aldehydirespiratoraceae bacterium]|jgi:2'-5' RNA ligase
MSRLFICLWPPEDVVVALEELHRKDQVGAAFVHPENWHVTLRFLGNADPNDVANALDTATFTAPEVRKAPGRDATKVRKAPGRKRTEGWVRLGPAVDVGKERMLFVPVTGVDDLAEEVVNVTSHLGDEPVRPRFLGHITVARLQKRANMPRALGQIVSADWSPTEVALVESPLSDDGARYDTLQTWPIS